MSRLPWSFYRVPEKAEYSHSHLHNGDDARTDCDLNDLNAARAAD